MMNNSNSNKTLIQLSEFKVICNLEDSELIMLLDSGLLPAILSEQGKILIDCSKINEEELGFSLVFNKEEKISKEDRIMIEEVIANEVLVFYKEVVEEALKILKQGNLQS